MSGESDDGRAMRALLAATDASYARIASSKARCAKRIGMGGAVSRTSIRRIAVLVAGSTIVLAAAAGPAVAVQGFGERPGYGNGDTNNEHSDGPAPKTGQNDWPGWAYGDANHGHEDGPPGQNFG